MNAMKKSELQTKYCEHCRRGVPLRPDGWHFYPNRGTYRCEALAEAPAAGDEEQAALTVAYVLCYCGNTEMVGVPEIRERYPSQVAKVAESYSVVRREERERIKANTPSITLTATGWHSEPEGVPSSSYTWAGIDSEDWMHRGVTSFNSVLTMLGLKERLASGSRVKVTVEVLD